MGADIEYELRTLRSLVESMREQMRVVADQQLQADDPVFPPNGEPTPPTTFAFQVERKGLNHKDRVTVKGGYTVDRDYSVIWPELEITLTAEAYIFARYERGEGWEEVSGHIIQNAATLPTPDADFVLFPIAKVEWSSTGSMVAEITQYRVGGLEFVELARGIVEKWSGTLASIPAGYYLCDGTNGTPDLRDKFIMGAGSSYIVGDTGGDETHDHGGSVTVSIAHSHGVGTTIHSDAAEGDPVEVMGYHDPCLEGTDEGTIPCDRVDPTADVSGEIPAEDHLPPFYALAYIWKR